MKLGIVFGGKTSRVLAEIEREDLIFPSIAAVHFPGFFGDGLNEMSFHGAYGFEVVVEVLDEALVGFVFRFGEDEDLAA